MGRNASNEWKTAQLGDVIELFDAQRVPLNSRERQERQGEYPYYGAQGIIDHIDDYIFAKAWVAVMPHAYTEDQLVEQPAIRLFADLGWSTVSALDETFGVTSTLSRETKGDVVLVSRLRAALERLNPALPRKPSPPLFQGLSALSRRSTS